MEDLLGENLHKRVIKELVEGKSFAVQLKSLLKQPNDSVFADELVRKIWGSFTQAITVLNSLGNFDNSLTQNQIEEVDQPDAGDRSSSELKKKKEKQDQRGCYKRRKTSGSWMRESETMNDGCAWRKYGQKKILNSKYPRCYYRCTHKYDQDCLATKQVQIIQENPIIMYHTTYFGNHTCSSTKIPKHKYNSQFNHAMANHSDSTVLKEKEEEEESKGQSDNVSSIVDSNLWQDFMPSSPSAHDSTLAANYNPAYYEEVISSDDMEDFAKFGELEAIEFC